MHRFPAALLDGYRSFMDERYEQHRYRELAEGQSPQIALIEDNTDNFVASALEGTMSQLIGAYNRAEVQPRLSRDLTLSVVELYPYVPYVQYLLAGSAVLAIFLSANIGGGIIHFGYKARGLH